ncbi:YkgJ family cysteine cluster protein [Pararhodospirillum oryzae]|uniref:Zinc/iron-chelating domain-containing protein n=1 Tax=Pararhodospirillum oryzae TaxID=478448 RepID=A0A512H5F7_9PROT|nr:YkgJ family cysteine cluster protein [Pararhodospirillum oryzae]GEO80699.1 hypothetical protein ROR02_08300 [Pararhodospirillum oryzae]
MSTREGQERRFACTACGRCCTGLLPLTLTEALARVDRFPLALVWTLLRRGARSYDRFTRLGLEVELGRRRAAVLVSPMAYLPPRLPCPDLEGQGRCQVHDAKPLRCRAMPFNPLNAPEDQRANLIPRSGWACDTSEQAPVVYQAHGPVDARDMQAEWEALEAQAPVLQAYARRRLALAPALRDELARLEASGPGGRVAQPFTGIVSRLEGVDIEAVATAQAAVFARYAAMTTPKGEEAPFHRFYQKARGPESA